MTLEDLDDRFVDVETRRPEADDALTGGVLDLPAVGDNLLLLTLPRQVTEIERVCHRVVRELVARLHHPHQRSLRHFLEPDVLADHEERRRDAQLREEFEEAIDDALVVLIAIGMVEAESFRVVVNALEVDRDVRDSAAQGMP